MSCDVECELVYFFSFEAIPVAESNHEVLDDEEVSVQVITVSHVEVGELFSDVVGEDREEEGVLFYLDHAVPEGHEELEDLACEPEVSECSEDGVEVDVFDWIVSGLDPELEERFQDSCSVFEMNQQGRQIGMS